MSTASRNIPLWLARSFFCNLLFFLAVWYTFETQYASTATLGLIYGVSQLLTIFLEIPSGYFADRFGRKASIIVGYFIQAVSWFIVGSTVSVSYIWIGYIVNGIGMAFVSGAESALDYDSLLESGRQKEYSKWMSWAGILHSTAIVIGIIAGGYIFAWNQRWVYYGVACAFLVTLGVVALAREPVTHTDTEGISVVFLIKNIREIWSRSKTRQLLSYYIVLAGLAYSYVFVFALVYASTVIHDEIIRSYIIAGIMVCIAVSVLLTSSRLVATHTRTLSLWGILLIVGYLGVSLFGPWAAPVWMLILYYAHYTRNAIVDQFINEEFPSSFRASLFSILNLGASVITFISLTLGSYIAEHYGYRLIFGILGGIAVLTFILFKMSYDVKHDH